MSFDICRIYLFSTVYLKHTTILISFGDFGKFWAIKNKLTLSIIKFELREVTFYVLKDKNNINTPLKKIIRMLETDFIDISYFFYPEQVKSMKTFH